MNNSGTSCAGGGDDCTSQGKTKDLCGVCGGNNACLGFFFFPFFFSLYN